MCYVVVVLTPNLYNIPRGNLGICSNKKQNNASFIKSAEKIFVRNILVICIFLEWSKSSCKSFCVHVLS